ncbi:MAG: glycosyltransferase family 2 protein [Armatimonadota bacterium]
MKVAAVIPAYNEEDRLGYVLESLSRATLVDEIIVVNDGSTDDTYGVASRHPGVHAIDLPTNVGKGGAMYAGAIETDSDIVLFLDGDLLGITGEQIDLIVRPVKEDSVDMCIGVFRGGRSLTDLAQIITPYISGQRALRRHLFLQISNIQVVRSGVEVAITKHFRTNGLRMDTVTLTGCTHLMKEEKMGYIRGFAARLRMYYDIGKITLDTHRITTRGNLSTRIEKRFRRKKAYRDSRQ